MDRILDFWNEIYDKSIELYHAYSSDYTFDNVKNLLNKYNDEEPSFYFNEERNELYIFYKDCKYNKRNIATIYCLRHIDRGG